MSVFGHYAGFHYPLSPDAPPASATTDTPSVAAPDSLTAEVESGATNAEETT